MKGEPNILLVLEMMVSLCLHKTQVKVALQYNTSMHSKTFEVHMPQVAQYAGSMEMRTSVASTWAKLLAKLLESGFPWTLHLQYTMELVLQVTCVTAP